MKAMKLLPAVIVTIALTACVKTPENKPMASKNTKPIVQTVESQKTVVYQCQAKKMLTVEYTFDGENAKTANVKLGKKEIGQLTRDTTKEDFTAFTSEKYVWNADEGLTLSTADKTEGVTLFQKGKKSDKILAKDCSVKSTK